MTIQQQCSHRTSSSVRKFPNFHLEGTSGIVSDNYLGRYLKQLAEKPADMMILKRRSRAWLMNHLYLLADKGASFSTVQLIGELFDSRMVPGLLPGRGRIASAFIRHHVANGKAYPGSNPVQILKFVEKKADLSRKLGQGTWDDTWLETDEEGIVHLMYAITWKKTCIEFSKAA